MDDGFGGGFQTVAGGNVSTHLTTFVILSANASDGGIVTQINRGYTYRLKYRAQNIIGWSDYSPVSYIQAATAPKAPSPISLVSTTSTTITISIGACFDNGGSAIQSYSLYRDDGTTTSNFVSVITELQYGLFTATGLTPGRLYFFKTTATNSIGESEFSTEDSFYAADAPSQPAPPTRGSLSTRT